MISIEKTIKLLVLLTLY